MSGISKEHNRHEVSYDYTFDYDERSLPAVLMVLGDIKHAFALWKRECPGMSLPSIEFSRVPRLPGHEADYHAMRVSIEYGDAE